MYCVHFVYVSSGFQSAVAYRCWVYINELQLKYNISQKISDILLFSDWGKQIAEVGFPQRGNICRDCPQLDTSNYLYFLTKTVTGQAECWWKMGCKHHREEEQSTPPPLPPWFWNRTLLHPQPATYSPHICCRNKSTPCILNYRSAAPQLNMNEQLPPIHTEGSNTQTKACGRHSWDAALCMLACIQGVAYTKRWCLEAKTGLITAALCFDAQHFTHECFSAFHKCDPAMQPGWLGFWVRNLDNSQKGPRPSHSQLNHLQ